MIPPFKSSAGSMLSSNKTAFNTLLSKPRVKSEHCIGIFKGRLLLFKSIRMKLGNKQHMERLLDYIKGGVILHNFLIQDPVEEDWLDEIHEGEDDLAEEQTNNSSSDRADYSRRDELYFYLSELEETTIN